MHFTSPSFTPQRLNNKWGIIDSLGNWVIEPHFDELYFDPDFNGFRASFSGVVGYIDSSATKWNIEPLYDIISVAVCDGLTLFRKKGEDKFGYMDIYGHEIIAAEYEDAEDFDHGFAAVVKDGRHGLIDTSGTWHNKI